MSIASEIEALKDKDGLVTAERVVDWARKHPRSALYRAPEFCGWDEGKLAAEHLLWAARRLIALNITYADGTRKTVSLSIDRSRAGGGYRDVDDVLRDQTLHELMLRDALRELERMEVRYARITALQPVWRAASSVRRGARKGRGDDRRESRSSA